MKRNRALRTYRDRRQLFGEDLQRIEGRRLTREDLLVCFRQIYERGYHNGYQTARLRARRSAA